KAAPFAFFGQPEIRDGTYPILNLKRFCVRLTPENLQCIDAEPLAEVDDDPLRARFLRVVCVAAVEIGIALPERRRVTIGQSRIAVVIGLIDGVSAVR